MKNSVPYLNTTETENDKNPYIYDTMSLQPTITVAQSRNGEILEVTDTTGDYDVTDNATGYGVARVAGTITANAGNDTFTLALHGMSNNEVVTITDVGSLTGLFLDQAYYVIYINTLEFSLSATPNGSPVNFGGTTGSFDFNVGWKRASDVARTIFQVESYLDTEIRYSGYLDTGTFIPQGTTEDTTTITSIVAAGTGSAEVIPDAVYGVTMIPIWEPPYSAEFTTTTLITILSVDLSIQYANAGWVYVNDSGDEYLLEISSIAFSGGNTLITLAEAAEPTGTFADGDWGLGIPALAYVNAYYNTYKCYSEQVAGLIPSDIICAINGKPSDSYNNAQILNMIIQGAIGNLEASNPQGAEDLIEAGVKRCLVIANQESNNCGCH